ncbi:MAG: DUF1491 family protein [Devosia sp.]|nr:DUF1491 family protein [Devosia sp.]
MFRSDIWVAAFVRRHNDIGRMCVVVRRGDPIAGQIFVEVDHLNGEVSLYAPAPAASWADNPEERVFQRRFDHVSAARVRERLAQEEAFDPDFWVLSLDLRGGDPGLLVIA